MIRLEPTRILLADDHALVRRGLRLILDAEPDLTVVAEAGNGAEAVELADQGVDLAILDIAMPRMTGIQAAREISRRAPEVRLLMLSMYDNEQYLFESLKAGASGYVLKSVADRDLLEACRAAMRGEPFLYPGAVTALIRDYLQRDDQGEGLPASILTPREEEIVKLIAEGHSSKEIADLLVISIKTVERHRANVLSKLGMRDRLELTRYAIRAGLVEP
ncbi:response regulator transcription factor [Nonomuraea glycinis]|jgi:DNA-binding NarL/FixJ family response regulator|uniref:response regulator n=1 Tax=Nonomuraea glycinis TaxID=2047744 RepID=UPI00166DC869|nr:response regulator transcription factor [Nonomuraea glycinis]MCA2176525.1 response regulator transcription factor [Nonomuraea glycinis]WSG64241.1 response regulator transcription factor [Nonomuraea glycinis]